MAAALPAPLEAALRGDMPAAASLVERADDPGWARAARQLLWLAQPDRWDRPALPASIESPGDVEAQALRARVAILELDGETLADVARALEGQSAPRAAAWRSLVNGQRAALAGDASAALGLAADAQQLANAERWPTLLVESVLLAAWAHMVAGDLEAALERGRRAAFMAQSERLWVSHFTVSILLARLRRLTGRPHLAGLIAGACDRASPPAFGGLLRWELLFAGLTPPAARTGSAADEAATAVAAWLVRGERLDERASWTSRSAPLAADLSAAQAAAGQGLAEDASVQAWVEGATVEAPGVLSGLLAPGWCDDAMAAAPHVVVEPLKAGRRRLGFVISEQELHRLPPFGKRPARPEAIGAVLALHGERGIGLTDLFERAYGFAYRAELHDASFRVVRHQAKSVLEPVAEIVRDGDTFALRAHRAFAISDPRTRRPLHDIVLRQLAQSGVGSAKEVASRLKIPLRTVQMALRQMTDDGACVALREGRRVTYKVEDTTFCELTKV